MTNEQKSLRVMDGCLVECSPSVRKVCSLGLGAITLYFPDGREKGMSYGTSWAAQKAYEVLQEWLEAHVNNTGDQKMTNERESTNG